VVPGAAPGGLSILAASNTNAAGVNPGGAVHAPGIVDGKIGGDVLGVPLLNALPGAWAGGLSARLVSARLVNGSASAPLPSNLTLSLDLGATQLAPGQVSNVPLRLAQSSPLPPCLCGGRRAPCASEPPYTSVRLLVRVEAAAPPGGASPAPWAEANVTLDCSSVLGGGAAPTAGSSAFVFSFPDFDGSAQYAAARLPTDGLAPCSSTPHGCPVVLATHGATVDAAYDGWTGALGPQRGALVLYPTGRGAFGPDWQGYGRTSMLRTLDALQGALRRLFPSDPAPAVDTSRVLWTGHSMGGHGCLLNVGRMPDRALGAACAAGWIKLRSYVPGSISYGAASMPLQGAAVLHSAAEQGHADVYASGGHLAAVAAPFRARMGQDDEAVSPLNLRRMARLIQEAAGEDEAGSGGGAVGLTEVPGEGHWFGSVMNFGPFVQEALDNATARGGWPGGRDGGAAAPGRGSAAASASASFRLVAPSASSVESVRGAAVLQAVIPARPSGLDVSVSPDGTTWDVRTTNTRRLAVGSAAWCGGEPAASCRRSLPAAGVTVDGVSLPAVPYESQHYCRQDGTAGAALPGVPVLPPTPAAAAAWAVCEGAEAPRDERGRGRDGPAEQALAEAPVVIISGSSCGADAAADSEEAALWLANDLAFQGRYRVLRVTDSLWLAAADPASAFALGGNGTDAPPPALVVVGGPACNAVTARLFASASASTLPATLALNGSTVSLLVAPPVHGGPASPPVALSAPSLGVVVYGRYTPRGAAAAGPSGAVLLLAGTADAGGSYRQGLRTAARFWPLVQTVQMEAANVGVPDVVVAAPCSAWRGSAGVVAAGWLDTLWRGLSPWSSVFRSEGACPA